MSKNNKSKTSTNSDKENIIINNSVLNLDTLNILRQLDPEGGGGFLKRLVAIYLSTAPESLIQIENAIKTVDRHTLIKVAHTFKSSAANVGAEKLADICKQLEVYGENDQMNEAAKLLVRIQHESRYVKIALEELLLRS